MYEDQKGKIPYGHIFNSEEGFRHGIKQLDSLYKSTKDLDYLSDKALLLILLKQYKEAVRLYLEIEQLQSNRYSTASNIGTAYELLGENEKALRWIKKAVQIDPKSHKNSEWIHVKILEAKIKGEDFYKTVFLLNTEFGLDVRPTSALNKSELQNLSDGLYYQLNERVSFVEPKEKIVAQLLFDLGNIAFLLNNYSDALGDYEQAKKYGFARQLIEQRIREANKLLKTPKPSIALKEQKPRVTYLFVILCAGVLAILFVIFYKRNKKNNS